MAVVGAGIRPPATGAYREAHGCPRTVRRTGIMAAGVPMGVGEFLKMFGEVGMAPTMTGVPSGILTEAGEAPHVAGVTHS